VRRLRRYLSTPITITQFPQDPWMPPTTRSRPCGDRRTVSRQSLLQTENLRSTSDHVRSCRMCRKAAESKRGRRKSRDGRYSCLRIHSKLLPTLKRESSAHSGFQDQLDPEAIRQFLTRSGVTIGYSRDKIHRVTLIPPIRISWKFLEPFRSPT
jgi:hypothetical protein